ncbi:hypothetical protein [Marinoscillum furvescens]|uniref:Uncharacterized protein n=1 Tax=Marinoscillum furvescens DSM 4134 TaxID=1122208 RepID=A0A3D9L8W7_MARFU|nr:hypothetical protein [Marinoscillum furvescens]REE01502.1 hypothetical protein C7460_10318 [Marinoscillum furvescens DSM 4134]
MRFPSFIKVSKYRRFGIEPRYYDPIKEEIEERTARIKQEMKAGESTPGYVPGRINFERKTESIPNSSFLQLLIAAVLGTTVIGWLYFGNQVFYALWLVVPVYLYFRLKKKNSRSAQ